MTPRFHVVTIDDQQLVIRKVGDTVEIYKLVFECPATGKDWLTDAIDEYQDAGLCDEGEGDV